MTPPAEKNGYAKLWQVIVGAIAAGLVFISLLLAQNDKFVQKADYARDQSRVERALERIEGKIDHLAEKR